MKENKRPLVHLFNAALWAVVLWTRMDTYFNLLPIHDNVLSPEVWQEMQIEYMAIFLVNSSLIVLFLMRFFLYKRKVLLLWSEAVFTTLATLFGVVGLILCPRVPSGWIYLFGSILLAVCVWSWYDLRKHYRTPV